MFAKIEANKVVRYPYSLNDLKRDNPNVTFNNNPDDATLASFGVARVYFTAQPQHNIAVQKPIESTPVFSIVEERWLQTWVIVDKTADDIAGFWHELQQTAAHAIQAKLDSFAQTRGYDNVMSACSYATSNVAKFKAEGQYCVEMRDATWVALYQIVNDVDNGILEMPANFEEINAYLPILQWPA
jgi:hypothetical protein